MYQKRNLPHTAAFLVVAVFLAAATGALADDKLITTLSLDETESYVWRGVLFDDDLSMQPAVAISYAVSEKTTIEVSGWWNIAQEGSRFHKDEVYEENYTLAVSRTVNDRLSLQAGYIYYANPKAAGSYQTDEVFFGASTSFGRGFLDATLYADIDAVRGYYLDVSHGWTFPLSERLELEPALHLGFADGFGVNFDSPEEAAWYFDDGLVDANVSLRITYTLFERFTIGLVGTRSRRFDEYTEATGEDETYTWLALSLAVSF